MKNVISILIDSVFSDCLGKGRTIESATPFIDSLLKNCIFAKNVYSYGPYTDAATKGLFCGMPTLSEYGYYFGINGSKENPYKVFKQNGYETYGFYYPYYLTSPKIESYIDHSIYTSGFAFTSTWHGKFQYYANLKKERELSDTELMLVSKCLELVFLGWLEFYKNVINNFESFSLVKDILPGTISDVEIALIKLEKEYHLFVENKNQYVNGLLELGMSHPLASIDPFDINLHINRSVLDIIYNNNEEMLKKAQKLNCFGNLRNNHFRPLKAIKGIGDFFHSHDLYDLKYPVNYYLGLNVVNRLIKRSYESNWKYLASARNQIMKGMELLSQRENNKPFYMFFHFLEAHECISFFSYDIHNPCLIQEEFEYLRPLVDSMDNKFKGSIVFQLALRYVDFCIKQLFERLNDLGILDNTVVLLYADHGSSYTYYPIRRRTVNCFHRENYNVPMILWDSDLTTIKCDGKYSSIDIYSTLYNHCNVKGSSSKGIVMSPSNGRDIIITEFMGPGCPDMLTRDVWISARSDSYMIAYKVNISGDFDNRKPYQLFDLTCDPLELHNLVGEYDISNPAYSELIKAISNRFYEIKSDRDVFLEKCKNGEIKFEREI